MTTRLLRVDPRDIDATAIAEAASVLRRGGLVAFPTETVYGLGANALDGSAVEGIFRAKGRPTTDPLIVHIGHAARMTDVAVDVPSVVERLAARFWPGPLTIILRKRPEVPEIVTAGLPTVAVRVPAHPVARALLEAAGVPAAAPSANRFSRPSPTTAEHVVADLEGAIDLVLDAGPTEIGIESTILDLTVTPPLVRRPGGAAVSALRAVLPEIVVVQEMRSEREVQPSPGQLARHYAPRAPLTLYIGPVNRIADRVGDRARSAAAAGSRVGILAPAEDLVALAPRIAAAASAGRIVTARYGSRVDAGEAARELFGAMRELDAAGLDQILAIAASAEGIGLAIIDRLTRAAEGKVVRVE